MHTTNTPTQSTTRISFEVNSEDLASVDDTEVLR